MSTEDRIDHNVIRRIARELEQAASTLSTMYAVTCGTGTTPSPALAASLPMWLVIEMYADYLESKGDYTPGTHNKDTPPEGIKEHIADYAKLHEHHKG